MRKEWNIETVDITPVAPQKQEENVPLTKKDKIKRFSKESASYFSWRPVLILCICPFFHARFGLLYRRKRHQAAYRVVF